MSNEILVKSSYLSFILDKGIFAVDVQNVLEVLEEQQVSKVPDAPDYILGVLNFRGEILPVINMRLKFNMPSEDLQEFVIIVFELNVNNKIQKFGGVADSVVDVLEVYNNAITSVPDMGSSYNSEYVSGMIKSENGLIMMLNIDKVFTQEDAYITMNENSNK